jgi:GNAT superfamily N-acetyltransferase
VSDVTGIRACLWSAFEPYRSRYTARAFALTVLTDRAARIRLRRMAVLVAVDPHEGIVGTVAVQRLSASHAHLRGMAVDPRWRGKGVATALLRSALSIAVGGSLRPHRVTLETTPPLRTAMRFYARSGFRRTGTRRRWCGMSLIEYERCFPDRSSADRRATGRREPAGRGRSSR